MKKISGIPNSLNQSLELPENFLGKQVEIIAFTIQDATKKPLKRTNRLPILQAKRYLKKTG
jgi:hypothetical protein